MKSVLFYEMTHASKVNQQTKHKVAIAVPNKNELGATPGAPFWMEVVAMQKIQQKNYSKMKDYTSPTSLS